MLNKLKIRVTTDCFRSLDLRDLDEIIIINSFLLNENINHLKDLSSIKIRDNILTAVNGERLVCIENLSMSWEKYFKVYYNNLLYLNESF